MSGLGRWMRRWAVLAFFLVTACTNDAADADLSGVDPSGEAEVADGSDDRSSDRSEPDATDLAALEPYISELLIEHDRVVNQISADPSVAADRESELVQDFLALYEPDSPVADEFLDAWREDGEAGVSIIPSEDTHPAFVTRLDGAIQMVSETEIVVPTYEVLRFRKVDTDGNELELTPFIERVGDAQVVRIEGVWRFRRRDVYPQMVVCRTNGGQG